MKKLSGRSERTLAQGKGSCFLRCLPLTTNAGKTPAFNDIGREKKKPWQPPPLPLRRLLSRLFLPPISRGYNVLRPPSAIFQDPVSPFADSPSKMQNRPKTYTPSTARHFLLGKKHSVTSFHSHKTFLPTGKQALKSL